MIAVVLLPSPGRAPPHLGLLSSAVHFIQPDGPWSRPERGRDSGVQGFSTAQLPAHHAGIVQVPAVITDGAPGALVKNLHSSGAATTSVHQADLSTVWAERNGIPGVGKGFLSCGTPTWAVGGALLWGCRPCWFRHGVFAMGQQLGLVFYTSGKRIIRLENRKKIKQEVLSWKHSSE